MEKQNEKTIKTEKFSSWLYQIRKAQHSHKGMDVSCGNCRACCTSSYFIHIRQNESKTLARIPNELLFPVPGAKNGDVLLGFNEQGHCPMFIENQCSIYNNRPQTCRDYDCRIFPATGLSEDDSKPKIVAQSNRWQFQFADEGDYNNINALREAAKFILDNKEKFPQGFVPINPTQQAVLALKVYEVFLSNTPGPAIETGDQNRDTEIVAEIVKTYKAFESKKNAVNGFNPDK